MLHDSKGEYTTDMELLGLSLKKYWTRRDFSKTPEPRGKVKEEKGNLFVIQEHHASNLHWDLRLERDGVLKSWAIPKGVPEKRGIRRLAIQTEDHPVEYAGFQGTIPEGEYGGGVVTTWDEGSYSTEKWLEREIIIRLCGKRVSGGYCMIGLKRQTGNWLLFRCGADE
jgi:bifunctional non-homologous end joining protein LigD